MKRGLSVAVALGVVMACGRRGDDGTPRERAGAVAPAVSAESIATGSGWPDDIGGVLAVATQTAGEALLFRRDTTVTPTVVNLLSFDSTAMRATVREVRGAPCPARARLMVESGAVGWTLAVEPGAVGPLPVDALADIAADDSLRLVARLRRIINTLPDTGNALEFRGLPVVIRDAWLVHAAAPFIVVRATRQRNLEAAAHEEQRFVIIEDDQPRFVMRVAGDEESLESHDLLAVLDVRGVPWLAVAREGDRTLQLELLSRGAGGWKSAWRSDAVVCAR